MGLLETLLGKTAGGNWEFLKQGPGHVPTFEERLRMSAGPLGFIGYSAPKGVKRGKSKTKKTPKRRTKTRRLRR